MGRVVHFEIHAAEPERAVQFYESVFGWKAQKWEGPAEYWLLATGTESPGIDGAILKRMGDNPAAEAPLPVTAFVCTVSVDDLDSAMDRVTAGGGVIVVPKDEIPGVGWLCYAKDSEGNILGLLQPAPPAS